MFPDVSLVATAMTVIPLPTDGKELLADETNESLPSNETIARPFNAFVCNASDDSPPSIETRCH